MSTDTDFQNTTAQDPNAVASEAANKTLIAPDALLPTKKIIELAKAEGVDFGPGNPEERIRYFIKLGLLPYAVRKSIESRLPTKSESQSGSNTGLPSSTGVTTTVGHLPFSTVATLKVINRLKQRGLSYPQISERFKQAKIRHEKAQEGESQADKNSRPIGKFVSREISSRISPPQITLWKKEGLSEKEIEKRLQEHSVRIEKRLQEHKSQLEDMAKQTLAQKQELPKSEPLPHPPQPAAQKPEPVTSVTEADLHLLGKYHTTLDAPKRYQVDLATPFEALDKQSDAIAAQVPPFPTKKVAAIGLVSLFVVVMLLGSIKLSSFHLAPHPPAGGEDLKGFFFNVPYIVKNTVKNAVESRKLAQNLEGSTNEFTKVLAVSSEANRLYIDATTEVKGETTFLDPIVAPNVIYSLTAGTGISITGGQTPTISATVTGGVSSVNSSTGALTIKGSGATSVSTSGSTITISSTDSTGTSGLTSEADTLATVTSRGATTATASTFSGGLTVGTSLTFSDTAGTINLASAGTLAFKDSTNTLFTIVDQGTYGTIRLSDKGSTGNPATCTAGDIYFNGTDANISACTAANTWEQLDAGGSGGIASLSLAGDSGTTQTLTDTNTITIAGGTNGIDTVAGATDTITLNLDTTEIGTATFGSGSAVTWTFDASAGTDTTIAFGDGTITLSTATVSGAAAFNGDTTIGNAAGDGLTVTSEVRGASPLSFEGATDDNIYTTFAITDPTVSTKTITFPNATGTVAVSATSPIALSSAGDISCSTCLVSGGSLFTLDGDDADTETISQGNTFLVAGGTNGIDTDVSATDTVTLNLDTTEIGTTTFGSGSEIAWTFNAGTTDPVLTFGDNALTIAGAATLTATAITTLNCTDCIDFDDIADSMTLDADTIIATGNTGDITITSDISAAGRSTDVLTISQANDATYNSTGNLLQLTNSDTGSTVAIVDISQAANGSIGIQFSQTVGSTADGIRFGAVSGSAIALTGVVASGGYVVRADSIAAGGYGLYSPDVGGTFVSGAISASGIGVSITGTSMVTGELLDLTATYAPSDGSQNEAIDINVTHTPTVSADNFRSIDLDTSDGTSLANTIYGIDSSITLTGNAAKTTYGISSTISSLSTTADTMYAGYFKTTAAVNATRTANYVIYATAEDYQTTADTLYGIYSIPAQTGAVASGTKNLYGIYLAPSSTGPTTGTTATTNVYGAYISTTGTHAAAAGTVNQYGLYVADGTSSTNGTSTKYGIYVASPTGADTNYAAYFAGGNVNIQGLTASSAVYTDASKNLTSTAPTSGAIGYWSRTSTTLSPTTANDIVSIANTNTTGADLAITNTGVYTGTGIFNLTADSATTGTVFALSADGLTTGKAVDITSTSTAGGASGISYLLNLARSGANSNAGHSAYGIYSQVTNTNATAGANIAGYLSASGATTSNYGLVVAAGNVGVQGGITNFTSLNDVVNVNKTLSANATDSWSTGTAGGTASEYPSSVLYNGKIYSWGGYNGSNLDRVDIYDIASNTWSTGTSGGTGRRAHSSVVYNGKIYSWGGVISAAVNTVSIYDIANNSWSSGLSGGTARYNHTSIVYNGKIYSWGGINAAGSRINSVDIYDIANNSWSTGTAGGTARSEHTSVLYNGKIYSWGGTPNGLPINTVDIYDIANDSWSTGTAGGTARFSHTSVLYNGKIYSWGGFTTGAVNTVDIYDIANASWSTGTAGGTARYAHASVFYNGKVYSWGGTPGSGYLNTLDIYDIGFRQTILALQENGQDALNFQAGSQLFLNSGRFGIMGGNVGIGNSAPTGKLDIAQSGAKTAVDYGLYLANTATSSTASINKYGAYITNTGTWNGASAYAIGLGIQPVTGGTNNIALCFDCDGTWTSSTVGAGIQFGTDANGVTLYRSASDTLKTDDSLVVGTDLSVNGATTLGDAATDAVTVTGEVRGASPLSFEGLTDDNIYTTFAITDPTVSTKTITFPNATGTVAVSATSPVTLSALGDIGCATCLTTSTTLFTLTGTDAGTNQTITSGDTLTIAAGTGIDTTPSATDTLTVAFDSTEIGTTTWGSGSAITWTFDASGGTDTTLAFGNGTMIATASAFTLTGSLSVTGNTTLGNGITSDILIGNLLTSSISSGATTQTAFSLDGTGFTTGELVDLTGTWAPTNGSTNEAIDINITHSPTTLADNFRGIETVLTDATTLGNTIYGIVSDVQVSGAAAKTVTGIQSSVSTSSTTADVLYGFGSSPAATGAIAAGTRSVYGFYGNPSSTGASSAGTLNLYGSYLTPSSTGPGVASTATTNVYGQYISNTATHAADVGTINSYGLYVANGTSSTNGTSTKYGIYVESPTGADTNYAAYFAGGNVNIQSLTASSAVYTDASKNLTSTAPTSGAIGYWSRTSTTLSPTTANDIVSIANTTTTGADLAITNTGVYTGTGIFNLTADSATTGTIVALSADGLTTGKGIDLTSTSNVLDSATLLNVSHSATAATDTTLSADIANFSFAPVYSTAVTTPAISGQVLDISRSVTTNSLFASTLTVSGALVSISDTSTQTTGTLTHTANVLDITQNYTSSSGTALYVKNYGGASSTAFRVDDASGDTTPFLIDATGNVLLGGTAESLANTGFVMDGDDLFVAGMAGVEGSIYTDGSFIAGASTTYSNGSISQTSGETLTIGTTAANLALSTTTSGNITATLGAAAGLFNVLTGNLKVGAGTPGLSLDGADAYITGTLEVDGAAQFDGAVTFNSTFNCTDCIDFDDIANSPTLDETTDINLSTLDLYVDLTSTGVFSIRDVATAYWTFDDDSTVDVVFPAAGTIGIDAGTTANTTTAGVIDLNVTSLTHDNRGLDIAYTSTAAGATTTVTQYGFAGALTSTQAVTATSPTFNYYGINQTTSKSGADNLTTGGTFNTYGIYATASNTSTDVGAAGTRNTYGGYFDATGAAGGTTTAYGIYATASGADNNYGAYFGASVQLAAGLTINNATSGTLGIGTSNVTTLSVGTATTGTTNLYGGNIAFNGNTSVASGNTFSVVSGYAAITGLSSGSNTTLTLNNHTSTGSIFVAQDAATPVFTIADGGTTTFTPSGTTTGTALSVSSTTLTTGEILDLTGTWAAADGSDNEAIDLNLTFTPTVSASTFRGIDLNVTEGANALANTDYALKVTMDNSANTSTGTHIVYGGHFTAAGKTAGTATAVGLYATASGADNNYAAIFDAGNVGIGTTGPTSKLYVKETGAIANVATFETSGSDPALITLINNAGSTYVNRIGAQTLGSGNVGLIFQTGGSSVGVTRMTINVDGNVGIGTTAPDAALEINNATGDSLRLTYNDADGSATTYTDFSLSSAGVLTLAAAGSGSGFSFTNTQPSSVGTTPGTAATSLLAATFATGGNTTIATTGTGGIGSGLTWTLGTGGTAASAVTASTGGAGGAYALTGGTGGASSVVGTTNIGGAGGAVSLTGGTGGAASAATSNTGGAGGAITIAAGAAGTGGNANGGTLSLNSGAVTGTGTSTINLGTSNTTTLTVGSSALTAANLTTTATGLLNVLTGNLKVGNGTPGVSLDGEDAYIEGTLEVDGAAQFDGAVTFNSTFNCTDCIDFDDIANSPTLDETTDINLSTLDLYVDLTSTGVFSIRDVATAYWTFDDDSTVDVVFPAAGTIGIDAGTTANTTTAGVIDLNVTSLTHDNRGLDIAYTSTAAGATTTVTQYGISNVFTNTQAVTATSPTFTQYAAYNTASKSGADSLTTGGTFNLYGVYGTASNTSTDVGATGTRNTYGGYFTATGAAGGTTTAVGLYATATGADNNYAAIFDAGNVGIGTTSPRGYLEVQGANVAVDNGNASGGIFASTNDAFAANLGGHISLGGRASAATVTYAFGSIAGRKENGTSGNFAGYLQFATNETGGTMSESMRITSGGNLGIGTTAPDARLEINHATGDSLRLTYNDADGSATNYTDFSLSSTGALTLTGSAATLADSATAEKTFFTLTPGTITLTGTTTVTSVMDTAIVTGATIAASAATIVSDAAALTVTAPIDSTNATLTRSQALRINDTTSGAGVLTSLIGLYIAPQTGGATNNYGLCFDCDGTWTSSTVASGIQFGTDANAVNLYRDGNDLLRTDDGLAIFELRMDRNDGTDPAIYTSGTNRGIRYIANGSGGHSFQGQGNVSQFAITSTASAVNYLQVTGATTGNNATLSAQGETNVGINITPKGTGNTIFTTGSVGIGDTGPDAFLDIAGTTEQLRLAYENTDTNYTSFTVSSAGLLTLAANGSASGLSFSNTQPAAVGTTPGTAATSLLATSFATGGNTTIATTGTGGVGSGLSWTLGTGGTAASAVTASTGGAGGAYAITSGTGGAAAVTGTGTNVGGSGGAISLTGGTGGAASLGTSNTGGAGGAITFLAGAAGTGGNANGGTLTLNSGAVTGTGTSTINLGSANTTAISLGNVTSNPTLTLLGSGTTTLGGDLAVNGATSADITTTTTTASLFNATATALNIGGAATTLNIAPTGSGTSSLVLSGGSADTGCTLAGATGNFTCSGNITGSSSGTVGFWTRTSTTLSPATANDIVSIANTTTTGADLAITNTGVYTGTGIFNLTADSATTGTIVALSADGLTTGKGIDLTSTSNVLDSATLLNVSHSATAATDTTLSADIANLSFAPTYSTAVTTPAISGQVLDISRSVTTNSLFASTLTVSGALVTLADSATQTTGTLTHTANVLDITQNYTGSSGTALYVKNYGGASSTAFRVDDASGDTTPFLIDAAGNVGIGTTGPGANLQVDGSSNVSTVLIGGTNSGANANSLLVNQTLSNGAGTLAGAQIQPTFSGGSSNAYGVYSQPATSATAITVANLSNFYAANPTKGAGSTITTAYGLYLESISSGSTNYSIYSADGTSYFGGSVGIGDTTPDAKLDIDSTVTSATVTPMVAVAGTIDNSSSGTAAAASGLKVTTAITPANNGSAPGRSIYGIYANLGTMTGISAAVNNTFADIAITPATVSLPGGASLTNRYGLYIDAAPAGATNNYSIYSAAGNIGLVLGAGDKVLVDGSTTASTGTAGVIDLNVTSLTHNNRGLDIAYTSTAAGAVTTVTQYGISNVFSSTQAVTATSPTFTQYAAYNTASKSGADSLTTGGTFNLYGVYGTASNTSTDVGAAGTRNTYGGYFTATGAAGGTTTATGLYATASGADNNYAAIFDTGNVGIGTTSPSTKLHVKGGALIGSSTSTYQSLGTLEVSNQGVSDAIVTVFSSTGRLLKLSASDNNMQIITSDSTLSFVDNASTTVMTLNAANVGIGTTAPDAALEINHATGDSLRLTYNDADGTATNYTDFSLSSTGALTLTGSAATLAASATAEKTFLTLTPGTVTLTAPTAVTSLMETAVLTGATIAADAATTVNKATTLSLVAPVDSTNATITDDSALRILNVTSGAGTLTNQHGIYVEDMTAGATADFGITIEGADTAALWISSAVDTTDAANGIAFGLSRDTNLYRSAANTLFTDDSFTTNIDLTVNGNTTLGNLNTADTLTGNLLTSSITSGATTQTALTVTASSITSGKALSLVGPTSTGVITGASAGFMNVASDVGSAGTAGILAYFAPDFSAGSATTSNGIKIDGTDSTAVANTNYNLYSGLALTGNAAKIGVGISSLVTSTSTTADTLYALDLTTDHNAAVTTGNKTLYGIRSQVTNNGITDASTGTHNIYGGYFSSTGNTGDTSTAYGIYATATGADTNYAAYFDGYTYINSSTAALAAALSINGSTASGSNGGNMADITWSGAESTSYSGDTLYIEPAYSWSTAVTTPAVTGSVIEILRQINTTGTFASTVSVTGPLVHFRNFVSQGAGTITDTADILRLTQDADAAGDVLQIVSNRSSTNYSILVEQTLGGTDSFSVTDAGVMTTLSNGTIGGALQVDGNTTLGNLNTADTLTGNLLTSSITSGATTQTAFALTGTAFTTGEILDLTGTWAPTDGTTNEAIDINITHAPTTLADIFHSINLTTTDGTSLGNSVFGIQNTLTLTGNAAKTGYGINQDISTNSTTADSIYGLNQNITASGAISTGTRSLVGIYSSVLKTGASTGGITNVYAAVLDPGAVSSTTGSTTNVYGVLIESTNATVTTDGTINRYGIYIKDAGSTTTGTSTEYGIYIEPQTGADAGYGLCFDCDGTWTSSTVGAGIQFGTDANGVTLYRSASDTLKTDDAFTATGVVTAGTAASGLVLGTGANATTFSSGATSARAISFPDAAGTVCISGQTCATSGTVGYWSRATTTLSPATANDIVSIANTTTTGADLAITNTGIYTGTGIFNLTANSATTGNIAVLSGTGMTTGEILDITGTWSPTAGGTQTPIDINITNSPSVSANTINAIDTTITDATALGNIVRGINNTITLTGNAAKTGIGARSRVTSSSTTADTTIGFDASLSVTGAISTGTRSVYGLRSTPTITGANTGGTTNIYAAYLDPATIDSSTGSTVNTYGAYITNSASTVADGTINRYGVYVSDAGSDTLGTSTEYGIYIANQTGADNGYGICFDCDGTWSTSTVAAGIQFGTDANAVTLYRSANDTLTTDDTFNISSTTPLLTFTETDQVTWQYKIDTDQWLVQRSGIDKMVVNNAGSLIVKGDITNNEDTTVRIGAAAGSSALILLSSNADNFTIDASGNVGVGDMTPDAKLDIDSTATTTNVFGITNTSFTTGEAIDITGTWSPTAGGTQTPIDINITNSPSTTLNTMKGLDLTITDGTALNNVIYGLYSTTTLTGNAAKSSYGGYVDFSSSSTTADTTYGIRTEGFISGAISTGTRNSYGYYTEVISAGANSGGTTNIYGYYSYPISVSSTTGSTTNLYGFYVNGTGTLTTGGTINQYGVYINDVASSTTGTSTKYGLYVANQTGADTNYGICFDCDGTYSTTTVASGIQFGTDASTSQNISIFRSNGAAAAQLTIEDGAGTDLIVAATAGVQVNLQDSDATERLCHSGADGATAMVTLGDCAVSGADFAEYFGSDGTVEPGDIVITDGESEIVNNERYGIQPKTFVKKSTSAYQPMIGIVSTNPYVDVLGDRTFTPEEHRVPIALSGQVPVKVNAENGPIVPGDSITTSSVPGVGMKATKFGKVVGIALQSYNGSGVSQILVFVNSTYYMGTHLATGETMEQLAGIQDGSLTSGQGDFLNTGVSEVSISALVEAGALDGQILTAEEVQRLIKEEVQRQLAALEIQGGTLGSTQGSSLNSDTQAQGTILSTNEATDSAQSTASAALASGQQLIDETNQTLNDLTALLATTDLAISTLTVSGNTQLAQTQVAGTFSQDGTFIIDYGKQANVLGATMYLQNDPLAGPTTSNQQPATLLDIGAGAATFDREGNLVITGTLTADKVETKEITIDATKASSATVGTDQIGYGQGSVTIYTTAVKPGVKILVTATTSTGGRNLYVSQKLNYEGFVVTLDGAKAAQNIQFDWLIVSTLGQR